MQTYEQSVEYDLLNSDIGIDFYETYEIVKNIYTASYTNIYMIRHKILKNSFILKSILKSQSHLGMDVNVLKEIEHQGIVEVLDVFETEERLYLIKEYIDGDNLQKYIDEHGPLMEDEVITIGKQLCDILEFLHTFQSGRIILRDLKPSNLSYDGKGKVKLVDLESSRVYKNDAKGDTRYIGTIGYAAPEQYGFGQTDERTDIYNLGMTLVNLLTGEVPEKRRMDYDTIDLNEIDASVKLKKIINKCCQFDPNKRYKSISVLKSDLELNRNNKKQVILGFAFLIVLVGLVKILSLSIQDEQLDNEVIDPEIINKVDDESLDHNVKNIEILQASDNDVLGMWIGIDFVNSIDNFNPQSLSFEGDLFLESVEFLNDGVIKFNETDRAALSWTAGIVTNSVDESTSEFVIADIDGGEYMFYQWISGDYINRKDEAPFFVLVRK